MHSLIITPSSACFLCYIFGLASALVSTSSQLASASRPKITASASLMWPWPRPWPHALTASLTSLVRITTSKAQKNSYLLPVLRACSALLQPCQNALQINHIKHEYTLNDWNHSIIQCSLKHTPVLFFFFQKKQSRNRYCVLTGACRNVAETWTWNNNACRSASAEIYHRWSCFPVVAPRAWNSLYHHLFELFPPSFHSDTSWGHFYSSTVLTDIH